MKITLAHLQKRSTKGLISENSKFVHTIIIAGDVIIGMHFSHSADICFPNVAVCFTDQNLFIQRNGFTMIRDEDKAIINYAPINKIQLHQDNDIVITLFFTYSTLLTDSLSQEAMIKQIEYFHIEATNGNLKYRSLIDQIIILRDFLIFSVNINVYIKECFFYYIEAKTIL